MSRKTNSLERVAASNAATGSPATKRVKERNDLTATATQPSDEVMNALFEQVAVRRRARASHVGTLYIVEKSKHVE